MYNCKDWDNYDNLESTETQVDHVMIDTRWEQKWTLKIMGLRMAVDGLWITGSEVLKATPDQHRCKWKGSWCSCDVDDDKTNNDNNNHREENGTYI